MSSRTRRSDRATLLTRVSRSGRRRGVSAAAGFAALALVLGACGEEGTAEEAVGGATSAVGSVATQATSAIGDATGGDSGNDGEGGGATTGEQPAPDSTGQDGNDQNGGESQNPDEEFLGDIRTVGVDTEDEQDYLTRGRDACASLDGGTGYVDVVRQYNDAHSEAPVTEAPVVVAAAVKAFCSQHLPQLGEDEGGDQGR